jgi:homopolymeric O-antigen transport system ATP-binding protein
MYVRLAFAVTIHLEPEILLIDEVLAVGDAAFQRKCLGKIGDVAKQGRTSLFVSHYMPAIESLCTLAHRLDGGRLVQSGTTAEVVDAYLSSVPAVNSASICLRKDRRGSGKAAIHRLGRRRSRQFTASVIQCSQDVEFSVGYTSDDADLKNRLHSHRHLRPQRPVHALALQRNGRGRVWRRAESWIAHNAQR